MCVCACNAVCVYIYVCVWVRGMSSIENDIIATSLSL